MNRPGLSEALFLERCVWKERGACFAVVREQAVWTVRTDRGEHCSALGIKCFSMS